MPSAAAEFHGRDTFACRSFEAPPLFVLLFVFFRCAGCGGIFFWPDGDGDHARGLQYAGEGAPNLGDGDGLHLFCPVIEVIQRQLVPGDVGGVGEEFGVAVQAQREAANQVVFGRLQFFFGGAALHKAGDDALCQRRSFFGLVGACL